MSKKEQLDALAAKRVSGCFPGYKNIGDYHGGAYDCAFVSPYTKSGNNVDSSILLILQDWISHEILEGPFLEEAKRLGRLPKLPTNRNLDRLLLVHFGLKLSEVYATNLFPFVKPGGMSASIPFKDLRRAAQEFALPQVRILQARLVVAFGLSCFNALRAEVMGAVIDNLAAAIESPFLIGTSKVWCQAHPGALGQNGRNRFKPGQVDLDWAQMVSWHASG